MHQKPTLPEEICQGVFVVSILVNPQNGQIAVRFLNVNEREVMVKNFKPRLEYASNYEIYTFIKTNNLFVERVDKVLDLIDTTSLNAKKKSIEKICAKYADVFYLEGDPLTVTNLYKQKINLKQGASPVYVKPYRLPHAQKINIRNHVDKMKKKGILEEATSEWSSPILIVSKKPDSTGAKRTRLVID